MENSMFCYQCEQTVGGKGCTKLGVCGKTPEIANLQDLLIYQLKGISCYAKALIEKGEIIDKDIVRFVENGLFTTLTNVNFDAENHIKLLKESQKIKQSIRERAPKGDYPDAFDADVNSIPLTIILSWYEQKAVADLLALLSLGVKGIYLGPSLPAFISPNVLQYLSDTFDLKPNSIAEDDLMASLKQIG